MVEGLESVVELAVMLNTFGDVKACSRFEVDDNKIDGVVPLINVESLTEDNDTEGVIKLDSDAVEDMIFATELLAKVYVDVKFDDLYIHVVVNTV